MCAVSLAQWGSEIPNAGFDLAMMFYLLVLYLCRYPFRTHAVRQTVCIKLHRYILHKVLRVLKAKMAALAMCKIFAPKSSTNSVFFAKCPIVDYAEEAHTQLRSTEHDYADRIVAITGGSTLPTTFVKHNGHHKKYISQPAAERAGIHSHNPKISCASVAGTKPTHAKQRI